MSSELGLAVIDKVIWLQIRWERIGNHAVRCKLEEFLDRHIEQVLDKRVVLIDLDGIPLGFEGLKGVLTEGTEHYFLALI
jgi:hypothetical protein